MNKGILIIVIVLIVIVGGYFLLRGGYQAPAPTPTVPAPEEVTPPSEEEVAPPEEEVVAPPVVKEFTVSGTEYSFNPSSITVSAGDQVKVTFSNTGGIGHNFVIREIGVGTRTISPGQSETIEFTAPAAGTYSFICSVPGHRAAGMEGSLRVE